MLGVGMGENRARRYIGVGIKAAELLEPFNSIEKNIERRK